MVPNHLPMASKKKYQLLCPGNRLIVLLNIIPCGLFASKYTSYESILPGKYCCQLFCIPFSIL